MKIDYKKHPAVMGVHLINACKKHLPFLGCRVLDPFAGIGTTAKFLIDYDVVGVELEPEWANQSPKTICGDSLKIVPLIGKFDAIVTSPAYGNRMADDFEAKDNSKRITYRHTIGRKLTAGTTANLHFGHKNGEYEKLHEKIWQVCVNALSDNGVFVLNCKDFIRNSKIIEVTNWHKNVIKGFGMQIVEENKIPSKGMCFGKHAEKRINHENIICFKKI